MKTRKKLRELLKQDPDQVLDYLAWSSLDEIAHVPRDILTESYRQAKVYKDNHVTSRIWEGAFRKPELGGTYYELSLTIEALKKVDRELKTEVA